MSDETELNIGLTDEQSEIESTLLAMQLDDSAIDQDALMYRAGWAAAMAQCKSHTTATYGASWFWPATAVTFAATTAACLFVLLSPIAHDGGPSAIATLGPTVESQQKLDREERPDPNVAHSESENQVAAKDDSQVESNSNQFKAASFFGLAVSRIVGDRNAQIQRYVAEAASPTTAKPFMSQIDWDIEPVVPLTPRSIRSSAL